MYAVYLLAILIAVAWWVAPPPAPPRIALDANRSFFAFALAAVALAASVFVQIAVMAQQTTTSALPIAVVGDGHASVRASDVRLALGILQTLLLGGVLWAGRGVDERRQRDAKAIVVGLTLACVLGAWVAPELTSNDVYAYIGQALTAGSPYHPLAIPLPVEDRPINAVWGVPVFASPYGPVWIALSRVASLVAPQLHANVLALRALAACAFAGCIVALVRANAPWFVSAAFALNPTLLEQYVVDAHNDVVALACVLFARIVRSRVARVALVVVAADVKWTFLFVGLLVFARERSMRARIVTSALAAVATGASYALFAGPAYFGALAQASLLFSPPAFAVSVVHAVAALVACAAVGAAFARRFVGGAAWSFVSLGLAPLPWYLAWGLPYALESASAPAFLSSLPALAVLCSGNLAITVPALVVAAVFLGAAAAWLSLGLRRRTLPLSASLR